MALNERNIFLLDGIGACMSAVFTGLILPLVSDWIGLPKNILHGLAVFPIIYTVYSLSCYKFVPTVKPWMLKAIIFGNLIYCFISTAVMLNILSLTLWGRLLLISEILILALVIGVEIKTYKQFFRS